MFYVLFFTSLFNIQKVNVFDGTLDGETSNFVGRVTPVDQQNKGFQEKKLKEEEPEDDDYLCKASKEGLVGS